MPYLRRYDWIPQFPTHEPSRPLVRGSPEDGRVHLASLLSGGSGPTCQSGGGVSSGGSGGVVAVRRMVGSGEQGYVDGNGVL